MKLTEDQITSAGLVLVKPRVREYAPFKGKISIKGQSPVEPISLDNDLALIWKAMMRRCYRPANVNYYLYGGLGISVAKRWQDSSTFISEVKTLPGWEARSLGIERYALDKDYYSSNQYSLDTCVWLPYSENAMYTSMAKPLHVTDCFGGTRVFLTISSASDALQVSRKVLSKAVGLGAIRDTGSASRRILGWSLNWLDTPQPVRRSL